MEHDERGVTAPAARGYRLLMLTTAAAGFAMAAQQTIVSNYFQDVLSLSGPEFGYITAIREIPGFLLIFLTALFYRVSLQRVTAGALVLLAVGYACFGFSNSFWSVAPWVILSSVGYHTWLQTQYALGMSLTTPSKAGSILGQVSARNSAGGLAAMILVLVGFQTGFLSFTATFVIAGIAAFVAAVAVIGFPHLIDGRPERKAPERLPFVLRREYRYYYALNLLDGGRQQIFFSFGLWVLVNHYGLGVPVISALLIGVTAMNALIGGYVGRLFDRYGEKPMLAVANVGYIIALLGYGLVDNLYVAVACYLIYTAIFPISGIGAATYLRKVAVRRDIAPSLAMGVTLQHVAAVAVPLAAGYILNFVGYQVPFLIACMFAALTFFVTRRLSPETQKSPQRRAEEAQQAAVVG